MIKVYDDNSVYVGEMISGERTGWGNLYILDDFFAGYKIVGHWFNDKLNGRAQIIGRTYTEEGCFSNGEPDGTFLRNYKDGRLSVVSYKDGKNVSEDVYSRDGRLQMETFGFVKLSEGEYYLGDVCSGYASGYGMIYNVDKNQNITGKTFGEIYGNSLVQWVELGNKTQENEGGLGE